MRFHSIDWLLFALYFTFLIYLSIRKSGRESSAMEDYLLAGRRLTLPSFVATTVSTWYGGILGVGEYSYGYGVSNWLVFGVPYYLGALIFALFLAGRANRKRLLTIPDQMAASYGNRPAVIAGVYIFVMTVPAAYVLMMGVLIKLAFGTTLTIGVILASIFTTAYIFYGGFKSDLRTDWLNFALMFGAMAAALVGIALDYGGASFLRANVPASHFHWSGGNSPGYIFSWYLIALSALIEPSFYQRAYAAKSPGVAKWGILLSIPLWMLFDFMTTSLGLYSRAILGPDQPGMEAFPRIADLAFGIGLKGLFAIGMFATIQSTVDSYSLLAASTLSHDFLGRLTRIREKINEVWLTRIGLLVGGTLSVIIALAAESAIEIWNKMGSLGTPGLMLPLALTYFPRFSYRSGWATLNMVVNPLAVGGWFYARSQYPSSFPFTIEPIYIGIGLALTILAADHFSRRRTDSRR